MDTSKKIKDFLLLNLGTFIMAVGIYFFKFPNHFCTGGVSGISVILAELAPRFSDSLVMFFINTALLVLGFLVFGRKFGVKTVYSSLMLSVFTWIFEFFLPLSAPLTSQPLLELIYAVGFPAVGSAILFHIGASSGGTDIIAMIVRRFTKQNIGTALLLADFIVALSACAVFGMDTGLFSISGLLVKALLVNLVLDNIRTYKHCAIATTHPVEICRYITDTLNHSATVLSGEGAYSHQNIQMIHTVVSRQQAIALRDYSRSIDPHCFMIITNSSEIIGKGFAGLTE